MALVSQPITEDLFLLVPSTGQSLNAARLKTDPEVWGEIGSETSNPGQLVLQNSTRGVGKNSTVKLI